MNAGGAGVKPKQPMRPIGATYVTCLKCFESFRPCAW
jgi:hypothetical protein